MFWKVFILMILCGTIGNLLWPVLDNNYFGKSKVLSQSILWSGLILIPPMFLLPTNGIHLFCVFILNIVIYYITQPLAIFNKKCEYIIRLLQIILTLVEIMFIFK